MGATSCPMERAGSARRSSRNRSTGRRSSLGLGKWQGKASAHHRNGARCAHATLDGAIAHSSVCSTPRRNAGARPMATELKTQPPQQDTPTSRFKQCLRERLRLARELAALRARFAAVVDDYERVIRTMQALAPSLHVDAGTVAHPTSPEWGPSALIAFADGHFLKHEQEAIDLDRKSTRLNSSH